MSLCKIAQTRTCIRRQTSIPYAVLRNRILQMLAHEWLALVEDNKGQEKLLITEKGQVFLDKYSEMTAILGPTNNLRLTLAVSELQV